MVRKISTIRLASSMPVTRAPRDIMLASLWARHISALKQSDSSAQRIPLILLAARDMPMPVPQIRMPFSYFPSATPRAARAAYSG